MLKKDICHNCIKTKLIQDFNHIKSTVPTLLPKIIQTLESFDLDNFNIEAINTWIQDAHSLIKKIYLYKEDADEIDVFETVWKENKRVICPYNTIYGSYSVSILELPSSCIHKDKQLENNPIKETPKDDTLPYVKKPIDTVQISTPLLNKQICTNCVSNYFSSLSKPVKDSLLTELKELQSKLIPFLSSYKEENSSPCIDFCESIILRLNTNILNFFNISSFVNNLTKQWNMNICHCPYNLFTIIRLDTIPSNCHYTLEHIMIKENTECTAIQPYKPI